MQGNRDCARPRDLSSVRAHAAGRRTSCTSSGTAWAPSTRTTRRSSITSSAAPRARARRSSRRRRRSPATSTRSTSCTTARGAMFPLPGPGARRLVLDQGQRGGGAPLRRPGTARGQTLEFANDRLSESLQRTVRRLITEPRWSAPRRASTRVVPIRISSTGTGRTSSTGRSSRTSTRRHGRSRPARCRSRR